MYIYSAGTYIGPDENLKGNRALLKTADPSWTTMMGQFTTVGPIHARQKIGASGPSPSEETEYTKLLFGWHQLNVEDFEIDPEEMWY